MELTIPKMIDKQLACADAARTALLDAAAELTEAAQMLYEREGYDDVRCVNRMIRAHHSVGVAHEAIGAFRTWRNAVVESDPANL